MGPEKLMVEPARITARVTAVTESYLQEEQLVAELRSLGVGYLTRQQEDASPPLHAPHELLADLVRQPSSRVRAASIALLLAHPKYAKYIPQALKGLISKDAQTLRFFYTAAVYLQQIYASSLKAILKSRWRTLPDLFSGELGVSGDTSAERIHNLAHLHAKASSDFLNWEGTYESAASNLLHRWEVEEKWKV
jgi:hypothetical protein